MIRVVVFHTIAITEETAMKMHVNQKVPNAYAKINALTVMMENIVNTVSNFVSTSHYTSF